MKLIVGLGNPGIQYEKTRHNIGWRVIEELGQVLQFEDWRMKMQFNAFISKGIFNDEGIILTKPQTFMNNSGIAVQALARYYKITPDNILIIHDDTDLDLGKVKIQKGRDSAGHKGVQSIIDCLGTKDFIRIRIGVRSPLEPAQRTKAENLVLEKFSDEEEETVQQEIKKTARRIIEALEK